MIALLVKATTVNMDIRLFMIIVADILLIIAYILWELIFKPILRKDDKTFDVTHIVMCIVVMILVPLIGPMFFLISEVLHLTILRQEVDLNDVVFSKDRVRTHQRGNVDVERDTVPLEEALNVNDTGSLRDLMMNVIRGDVKKSLASISMALNSEDSETSHYAASVLRDEINDFNTNVQKIYKEVFSGQEDSLDYAVMLIEYMQPILEQNIFSPLEQRSYIDMMDEATRFLYEEGDKDVKPEYLVWVTQLLCSVQDYQKADYWCAVMRRKYPDELGTYTCQMKLYYELGDKERFFDTIDRLKSSKVVIDKATLEQIRIFSGLNKPAEKATVEENVVKEATVEEVSVEKESIESK